MDPNEKMRPKSTRFLKRAFVETDTHSLIGRIYDLGVVEMYFDDYEALAAYPDCRYVFYCGRSMQALVGRVNSLNEVGSLIWVDPLLWKRSKPVVDRYAWINIAFDVLLMRLISVHDCVLQFVNDVFELGLKGRQCSMANMLKQGLPRQIYDLLRAQRDDHELLRHERNARVHQGWVREHSSCDVSFKLAAVFEHCGNPMRGKDSNGRRLNTERYMKEALVDLQREYNNALRSISKRLREVYDLTETEFDVRFHNKFNDPETGFGYKQKQDRM